MSITDGRVFFLGAGFSAGAGVPLTNALLPEAISIFQQEAPDLCDRVSGYADEVDVDLRTSPDAEDFARLCTHIEFIELREYAGGERWSNEGSREKLALKFFLAKAIALNTPPGSELPEHYLSFARSLTPNDIIVTFNWDLLLESAIECVGGEYCYNYEVGKIHIVKLHGSINWVNNTPQKMRQDRPDFGYRPLGFTGGMMDNEVFCSNELHRAENWHLAMSLVDEVQPMIILPGYGKAFDVRSLSILWYRLEALAIRKGGVSIIGLNVSHDDFIVESLFRYLLRSTFSDETLIRVVNPEPVVGSRFQRLAGTNKIEFHCELFSTDSIESALLK